MTKKKIIRKPRPIIIKLNGRREVLKPFNLPLSELERVKDWLERVCEWKAYESAGVNFECEL
jgi:hypothetical protein